MEKKQKIGAIYKIGGFLAFLMLGYLGLRGYKNSVEQLKINGCIKDISILSYNIQETFRNQHDYGKLDYNQVVSLRAIPERMRHEGFGEALNSYLGGVDIFYSSFEKDRPYSAFEISFQGLSSQGCMALVKMNWDVNSGGNLIAIAGYPTATPAGVLDEIYPSTASKDIKESNVFKGADAPYVSNDRVERACACKKNICSVVWKFH